MQGLTVQIFKSEGRSFDAYGRFSSKVDVAVLVPSRDFPDVPKLFDAREGMPAVAMVKRTVFGKPYLTAYPVNKDGSVDENRSFGGCYISTSDGRFPAEYPVPLHDRIE